MRCAPSPASALARTVDYRLNRLSGRPQGDDLDPPSTSTAGSGPHRPQPLDAPPAVDAGPFATRSLSTPPFTRRSLSPREPFAAGSLHGHKMDSSPEVRDVTTPETKAYGMLARVEGRTPGDGGCSTGMYNLSVPTSGRSSVQARLIGGIG